jgi:hypothetical protein
MAIKIEGKRSVLHDHAGSHHHSSKTGGDRNDAADGYSGLQ